MIVVTGGAGFIGSNIIYYLNKKGLTDIVVVDNISNTNKYLNIAKLDYMDYIDKKDFLSILPKLGKIDMIIHQGACSSTIENDGYYMLNNNYEYSKELLNHCISNRIKFLYASSASVYGNGLNGFSENRDNESPLNVYAFSKYLFDNYVRQIIKGGDTSIPITGLRYFNVFGYQETHKESMASVVFHFAKQIQEYNKIKLFEGSKDFIRDFIFIDDVIKVLNHFINHDISGIYNCGTGQSRSFYDIARIMKDKSNGAEIEFVPFPEHLVGKYQKYTEADLSKLRETGFTNEFNSLEDSVSKYYDKLNKMNGYLL
jgi:ADP-L-glycero-D-manno-heptose 6-epimerase